ncbi:MAG: DUF4173 domain-containing protein [Gemmatimonadaceae bacterium]
MAVGLAAPYEDNVDLAEERPRHARRILVEGLSLGFLADVAMRTAPGGLGWTLWVVALALAALNVARHRGLRVSGEQVTWLVVAVACAAAFSWRDAEALRVVNVLGTLVAIAMFAMSAAGAPATTILVARIRDVIAGGVYTVRDLVVGTPMLVAREARLGALPAVRGGASWSVLRAALVTAPIALIFATLLSRADPVFASLFRLPVLDLGEIVPHLAVSGAFAWWSAGWLRGALLGTSRRPAPPARFPMQLGLAEVTTSLGVVIALFAIFVTLQLRWLFAGADVVLATTGLTVAEYARRGFFELVAVSALVLPLILGTRALIEDATVVRRHRALSTALLALLAAIMASALLRMALYVSYFGLSSDRLYATAIMLWLAMVSGAMALTVLRGRPRTFAALTALSGFATLGTLNVLNPDVLITRVNLSREATERTIDLPYLSHLSGDAMPTLVKALQVAAPSQEACIAATTMRTHWMSEQGDPSWNIGAWRGRIAVIGGLHPSDVVRLCAGVSARPSAAH